MKETLMIIAIIFFFLMVMILSNSGDIPYR